MDDFLGYLVVAIILGLLILELIRQMKNFKFIPNEKSVRNKSRIMILSLFGIILFYSMNIIINLEIIANEFFPGESTSIGMIISFTVYMIAKFYTKSEQASTTISNSLFK